jgi:septal ring factor EnvC (AmiA/AmiB activator)
MFKKFAAAALVLSLAVPAFAQAQSTETPRLDKREANMQKRIEQGKASGALNEKEAARMEKRVDKLEKAEDRAKADGVVTAKERARLEKKADRTSKAIYREKHDKQTEAPKQ